MSNYRRVYVPGGVYFFTLVTYRRQHVFVDDARSGDTALRVTQHYGNKAIYH